MDTIKPERSEGEHRPRRSLARWRGALMTSFSVVLVVLAGWLYLSGRTPSRDVPEIPRSLKALSVQDDALEQAKLGLQSGDFDAAHRALERGQDEVSDPLVRAKLLDGAVKLAGRRARHELLSLDEVELEGKPFLMDAIAAMEVGQGDAALRLLYRFHLSLPDTHAAYRALALRAVGRLRVAAWRHQRGPASMAALEPRMLSGVER